LFRFRRGGEVSGVDPWVDPVASSRDLFFPAPVSMLFDGEDFILQVEDHVWFEDRWMVASLCDE
jgi:hypothetical protein